MEKEAEKETGSESDAGINRVGGLVKLMMAELVMVLALGVAYSDFGRKIGVHGCAPEPGIVTWGTFGFLAVGSYLFYWVFLKQILFAKTVVDSTGYSNAKYSIVSTHPSYAFIDLLTVGLAWIIHYAAGTVEVGECANTLGYLLGTFMYPLAWSVPIFRLFCWYVLGQRTWKRTDSPERKDAWKPVAFFYAVLAIPGMLAVYYIGRDYLFDARFRVADEQTLAGGMAAHPDYEGTVWKVKGKLAWDHVARCKCDGPAGCAQGEMLLDLGAGGEVIVQRTYPGGVRDLVKETEGKRGKLYKVNGWLHKLPNRKAKLCGTYGPPPPAGRVLLEWEGLIGVEYKNLPAPRSL